MVVLQIGAEPARGDMGMQMAIRENDAGIVKDHMDGLDAVLNKLGMRGKQKKNEIFLDEARHPTHLSVAHDSESHEWVQKQIGQHCVDSKADVRGVGLGRCRKDCLVLAQHLGLDGVDTFKVVGKQIGEGVDDFEFHVRIRSLYLTSPPNPRT